MTPSCPFTGADEATEEQDVRFIPMAPHASVALTNKGHLSMGLFYLGFILPRSLKLT
jgi:hypothetical protein